ncbi:MAG: MinD/ParA family protein [Candidatus Oleimicrobiaceae bacterium]
MRQDQLATVRELVRQSRTCHARLVAVASGKGGVGKTNVAINLGIALVEMGKRVLLVDADQSLANVDLLLGVTVASTSRDVLLGGMSMEQVIFRHESGLMVLPGSAGLAESSSAQPGPSRWLVEQLWPLRYQYDFLILDTAAGLTYDLVDLLTCADEVIIISTPEPTAINDAYALVKVLHRAHPAICLRLLLNMVESPEEAEEVWERFALVVRHFLKREILCAGYVVGDWSVAQAVKRQRPLLLEFPEAAASECIRQLASTLLRDCPTAAGGDAACAI